MNHIFLPVPKKILNFDENSRFRLNADVNIFVNKAKVQDFIMDFFGFFWKNFKIILKIVPIKDAEYLDEYNKGFFMYVTHDLLPRDFVDLFMDKLGTCGSEGYVLSITSSRMYLIAKTKRGFFNGVLTLQQMWEHYMAEKNPREGKPTILLPEIEFIDHPDLELRMVHFDLKRQLHSLEYLKDHIRLLAHFKINAILWEWEDKFPYRNRPELKHPLGFSTKEAQELMELCQMYGIESIPLIQSYGHLEFVLKRAEYKHLREVKDQEYDPEHTMDICPLEEGTLPLINDMIADMVRYHHRTRYIHIGGDEVYSIGTCEKCRKFVEEHGDGDPDRGKSKLYITHVNEVIKIVKSFGKIPMIWHDYLLKYPDFIDELDKDVVIVYWQYGEDKKPNDFKKEIQFFKDKGFKIVAASSVRSDFQYAIPTYSIRFKNIHELNSALVDDPEKVVGSLATSWPVCRAPMETTIPGLLFFAESSWNVKKGEFTQDVIKKFTDQLLNQFFYVPKDKLEDHAAILTSLIDSTPRPRFVKDLGALLEKIDDAIQEWEDLSTAARARNSVIENILHGLKLQKLKVRFFKLADRILEDLDGFYNDSRDKDVIGNIKNYLDDVKKLRDELELNKYRTREVYEKVIYDDEIPEELKIRFGPPIEFLDNIINYLKKIQGGIKGMVNSAGKINSEDLDKIFLEVKDNEHAKNAIATIKSLVNNVNESSKFPKIEDLEGTIAMINNLAESGSKDQQVITALNNLGKSINEFLEGIDSLLDFLSMKKIKENYIQRF
ncbi:MAG: family 20 glycosylhydrolase [Promethearchaeota archaeon]